jgi:hypothetical protein
MSSTTRPRTIPNSTATRVDGSAKLSLHTIRNRVEIPTRLQRILPCSDLVHATSTEWLRP